MSHDTLPQDFPRWYAHPGARAWRAQPLDTSPREFHRTLEGYAPTPLIELPAFAQELGVRRVFVKDESQRLGLPAFKIVGASYAIARALSERLGENEVLPFDELRGRVADAGDIRLVAATDGNHGRAVARFGRLLGLPVTIYIPPGAADAAMAGIRSEGAELIEPGVPYDEVVAITVEAAASDPNAILVQDSAQPGGEEVARWIVDGYDTLASEVDEQLGDEHLDLFVVGAGVGALAQGIVQHYRSAGRTPAVLVTNPEAAPGLTVSLTEGRIVPVGTGTTVMTGLNCGTVSELAWPTLRDGLDASVVVTDGDALAAMRDLQSLGVDAGPCGAASLAGTRAALAQPDGRKVLGLDENSVIVLLSSEGFAANPKSA